MTPTRIGHLAVLAGVLFVLVNIVAQTSYQTLPPMPIFAGLLLGVLAIVDGILAYTMRPRFERRRGATPVSAHVAVRVLALAKASSLLGAVMTGAWIGLLGYVAPRAGDAPTINGDILTSALGAVCAVLLVGGGLWLERICRVPEDPDAEDAEQDGDR